MRKLCQACVDRETDAVIACEQRREEAAESGESYRCTCRPVYCHHDHQVAVSTEHGIGPIEHGRKRRAP